ncbi:hypothetical protein ABZZ47_08445 [Streptomyces sp. NPDC006465]|uniref:hypothetical protein n=1 Tax=Streptomyces sp. NPDC006465 TaxID=3157174 RepID=UPI0033B00254
MFITGSGATHRRSALPLLAALTTGALLAVAAPAGAATEELASAQPSQTLPDLPSAGSGQVTMADSSGARLGIGLPGSPQAQPETYPDGTVMYSEPDASTDVAVRVSGSGAVSALVVLKNAAAPREFRFPLSLPDSSRVVFDADGGLSVADGAGHTVGSFAAPWAVDANGAPVKTSYRLEGGDLVQTVEVDESTAFPVVADPSWWDKAKEIGGGMVSDTWNSMKCGAALGAAFVPGAKAYKVIKAAGGIKKILTVLASVDTKKGALSALGSGGSTLFGIKAVKKACFDDLK